MIMLNEHEEIFLKHAVDCYCRNQHYFYTFLRPVELCLFRRVMDRFVRPVADFGCGDGFFASLLEPSGSIEFGIDQEPRILQEARNAYQSVVLSHESTIDLPSGSIGTIISNSVFEHLISPEAILRELYRVLAPGGRLFATITLRQWERDLQGTRRLGNFYARYMRKMQRHRSMFDLGSWQKLFEETGFRIHAVTGYLDAETVAKIEVFHYLCLPSLMAQILPKKAAQLLMEKLNRLYLRLAPPISGIPSADSESPCCFVELEKSVDP